MFDEIRVAKMMAEVAEIRRDLARAQARGDEEGVEVNREDLRHLLWGVAHTLRREADAAMAEHDELRLM